MLGTLRLINLGVRFLLELTALGVFAYWGATVTAGTPVRTTLAIGLPLLVALFWGIFVSPKARVPTGRAGRAGLGLVVFLGAAVALQDRGHPTLALAFGAIAVVSSLILYVLPQ